MGCSVCAFKRLYTVNYNVNVVLAMCSVFAQVPEARSMLKAVGSDDTTSPKFIAHAMRVLTGIDITINLLDQPDALAAQLEHLHHQHEEKHVPERYFKVGYCSLHVLQHTEQTK